MADGDSTEEAVLADGQSKRLRNMVTGEREGAGAVVAAGCFDALSARVAEAAGFETVYMTGNGTSAVRLGGPDVGLLTMSEMVDSAQRIADAVRVPLIADADTGYGGILNVIRTVEAYRRAGVAALHLEDQELPKRCGHLGGKSLVSTRDHASRISAAVSARGADGPLIIGRTDAVSVEGVASAIERARAYGEAGADLVFVEGLGTADEIAHAADELADWPLAFAWVDGRSPQLTAVELGGLGVDLVIYPLTAVLSTLANLKATYGHLATHGTSVGSPTPSATFEEYNDFLGVSRAAAIEQRFAGN